MERFVCCSGNPIDVLSLRLQNRQGQVGKRSIGFMQRPVLSCDVSRLRIDQVWRVERNRKLFVCPGFRFRVYGGQSSGEQSGDISPDDHNIHEDDQNASSFHTDEFYGKEQQEIEETQKRTSMCDDDVRNSRNPSTANHRDSIHASSSISSSGEYEPLAREFENFRFRSGTEGAIKLTKRLELLWSITERKGPELCPDCRGSGEHECEYCHGTGVMTVGDSLFCNQEGCRPCPVCRGTGACQCAACRGTGKRASWVSQ